MVYTPPEYFARSVLTVQIFLFSLIICSPNTGKYRPEISPYLETFHAVMLHVFQSSPLNFKKF